jgi:hypothetical protein
LDETIFYLFKDDLILHLTPSDNNLPSDNNNPLDNNPGPDPTNNSDSNDNNESEPESERESEPESEMDRFTAGVLDFVNHGQDSLDELKEKFNNIKDSMPDDLKNTITSKIDEAERHKDNILDETSVETTNEDVDIEKVSDDLGNMLEAITEIKKIIKDFEDNREDDE